MLCMTHQTFLKKMSLQSFSWKTSYFRPLKTLNFAPYILVSIYNELILCKNIKPDELRLVKVTRYVLHEVRFGAFVTKRLQSSRTICVLYIFHLVSCSEFWPDMPWTCRGSYTFSAIHLHLNFHHGTLCCQPVLNDLVLRAPIQLYCVYP